MTISTTPLDELTLEQKAALGSGADFWTTKSFGAVGPVSMSDGPHGLRQQDIEQGADHLGIRPALPATCFPPAVGLSQTWNRELVRRVGEALGVEAQALGVNVLLGPGVNIKRDPRGGRSFEYFSEDPLLSGELATEWVQGLQSQGVGASLKHFVANDQEADRMRISADIDPRPLREIYLRPFQRVVEAARPWTVMCSYNKLNGVYTAANRWLLTEVLRGEWGFDGVVVSDWGAVDDRVASVRAGLDLEMPAGDGENDRLVVEALADGSLDRAVVEESASRLALLAERAAAGARPTEQWDLDEHHALAREIGAQAAVLLKNEGGLLPLRPEGRIAVVGAFAIEPRFQGGGSSHVNATRVDVPLEEIRALAPSADVTFARGFATDGSGDDEALRREAVSVAAAADVAVVFLGLAERQESEGFDRDHIDLPTEQLTLLAAIVAEQPRAVVVLSHGGVLRLAPVAELAPAVLDAALLGQAAGGAVADVLFGVVNPSGRLTETVPVRLEDAPAFTGFPGEEGHVRYGEGLYVGYRWYDARDLAVTFPFGHGLSYTSFDYSGLSVQSDDDGLVVRLRVTNSGERAGTEVVQVYSGLERSRVLRAPRVLVGFTTEHFEAGETRDVTVRIRRDDLAYWNEPLGTWTVETGEYTISVGSSSRDLRLTGTVEVAGDFAPRRLTFESSVAEVMDEPVAAEALGQMLAVVFGQADEGTAADTGIDMVRMIGSFPIGRFARSLGGQITRPQLQQLFDEVNRANGVA